MARIVAAATATACTSSAWGEVPDELFRTALALGAENVAELPGSDAWLVEPLTDLGDDQPGPRA